VRIDLDEVVGPVGDRSATHTEPSPASMARGRLYEDRVAGDARSGDLTTSLRAT
jgi:hypothetical protein